MPRQLAFKHSEHGNPISQLLTPPFEGEVELLAHPSDSRDLLARLPNQREFTITSRVRTLNQSSSDILFVASSNLTASMWPASGSTAVRWLWPKSRRRDWGLARARENARQARESWADQFSVKEERIADGELVSLGLRTPQIGALFSVLGHWRASDELATVVMPTGTGKTEVMLTLTAHEQPERLLVIVPTDALREQISNKFMTWGMLQEIGVLTRSAQYPVVGVLKKRIATREAVTSFFGSCNVVVATMAALCSVPEDAQDEMAALCSHLFIDEAHHTPASTWHQLREKFAGKKVVQFTATPFRNDGRLVEGKVAFNYPLSRAQRDGYFRPVNFRPVEEYVAANADRAIAVAATRQLNSDLSDGLDHLLMARTSSIERAEQVHAVYQAIASDHRPLLIHSKLAAELRVQAVEQMRQRSSRIIVCVDMLGEGFDLPELKIAALHDMHKSLAITLQFTGRFTRVKPDLGEATIIANIADAEVEDSIASLYAESSDWNVLLRDLSEDSTRAHTERSEFIREFEQSPSAISLRNLAPNMSALVYRTNCTEWRPASIKASLDDDRLYAGPLVNRSRHTLIFVTMDRTDVKWGNVRNLTDTAWNLHIVHWSRAQGLLFINSSEGGSNHEWLARLVTGAAVDERVFVDLIKGERIFRVLSGVNQLTLLNLGLRHVISKAIQFSMHMGADIGTALTAALRENKSKSNLFGKGFEGGKKATIGCSLKGRVWSYRVARDLSEWVSWCRHIGGKLLNESIDTATLFEHVITPEEVSDRPALVPVSIDWFDDFSDRRDDLVFLNIGGHEVPLFEVGIDLVEPSEIGPLRFRVYSDTSEATYEIRYAAGGVTYSSTGSSPAIIRVSRREYPLVQWFDEHHPVIRFEDGSFLQSNELSRTRRGRDRVPFDIARIDVWDWTGVDIRVESQGPTKRSDSIQRRVIDTLLGMTGDRAFDFVFDDDGAGEVADVVAIKQTSRELIVCLYHCKYAHGNAPGARVADLYEVCGQTQKSVVWKEEVQRMLRRLRSREVSRISSGEASRIERGTLAELNTIARKARVLTPVFHHYIVQPGISRSAISRQQLDLLAVTELYLRETYEISLDVVASA